MTKYEMTHSVRSGDDVTLVIKLVDTEGAAVDLTGTEITWGLAPSPVVDPRLIKTQNDGVTITDAPNGTIEIELAPADTSPLTSGEYHHEVQVVDGNGEVTTFVSDKIEVEETIIDNE